MSIIDFVRSRLRESQLWVKLRAFQRVGVKLTFDRWRLGRKVLKTKPIRTVSLDYQYRHDCEVHILIWDQDVAMGLWAAKSFYTASQCRWPLIWHQGGALSGSSVKALKYHFPDSSIVLEEEILPVIEAKLNILKHFNTIEARKRSFMLRKLIDCVILARSDYLLLMDTDVLFFQMPHFLIDAVREGQLDAAFNRDENSHYNITPEECEKQFGFKLKACINAGLGLIRVDAWHLEKINLYLGNKKINESPWLVEQTLQAMLASQSEFSFFPETYLNSSSGGMTSVSGEPCVAKHYASHPRPFFFREGIPKVIPLLESL